MEKFIRKQIIRNFTILFFIVFLITSFFVFDTRRRIEVAALDAELSQVVNQYEQSKKSIKQEKEEFKKNYIQKAYSIDKTIQEGINGGITSYRLFRIKELIGVEEIHLIDKQGEIVYSSEEKVIGKNLNDVKDYQVFEKLFKGESDQDIVQFHKKSIDTDEERILFGIKSTIDGISMLGIEVNQKSLDSVTKDYSVDSIISKIPTIEEETIFAVDRRTGEICGITQNNNQKLVFKEGESAAELVKRLESFQSNISIKINGKLRHLKIQVVDNYILGIYIDSHQVYKGTPKEIGILIVSLLFVGFLIYHIVILAVRKFVLDDLKEIDNKIQSLLVGEYNIQFESKYPTEFQELSTVLNRWKWSYEHKSERMSRMIRNIDINIAVFECLVNVNLVFFSDNFPKLLNISEKEMRLLSNPARFEQYLDKLLSNMDKNGTIKIGDCYIEIKVFKEEGQVYGIVVDKTKDVLEMKQIENRLAITEQKIYQDRMSGVYNREGLEVLVDKALQEWKDGVLLIFDIDNFKAINDNEGHPKGDEVIIKFASFLKKNYTNTEIIGRMGGDEFAVYIKGMVSKELIQRQCGILLKEFREEFEEYVQKYHISASIGISYVDDNTSTYERLYHNADMALYVAKNRGKNDYCIYDKGMEEIK